MQTYADIPDPHYPVRDDWLALHEEAVLEPELSIVDPHHHLWDKGGHRYFLDELLADINTGHNIVATMFMECGAMYRHSGPEAERCLGETEFANGVAALSASGQYGEAELCAGLIGGADLRAGDAVTAILEQHMAIAGSRFKGIRQVSAWHDDPAARGSLASPPVGILADAGFREGIRALTRLGLSFDAYMYHTQLGEMADLAHALPDTNMILNHVGGVIGIGPYENKRDEEFVKWRADMQTIATLDNVSVKLGGLGMRVFGFGFGDRPAPPSSKDLAEAWKPYIETCIELFGPERCMFESNFPVDKGTCSYPVIWNAFKRITSGTSAADKHQLFSYTARSLAQHRCHGSQRQRLNRKIVTQFLGAGKIWNPITGWILERVRHHPRWNRIEHIRGHKSVVSVVSL